MSSFEKIISGVLGAILLYLVLFSNNTNTILGTLGTQGTNAIRALQGR